eukprot:14403089-Alexandrium_andersonii.AAC.1
MHGGVGVGGAWVVLCQLPPSQLQVDFAVKQHTSDERTSCSVRLIGPGSGSTRSELLGGLFAHAL